MKGKKVEIDERSWLARAVLFARCNGGEYHEPPQYTRWPRKPDTWLQRRLKEKVNND